MLSAISAAKQGDNVTILEKMNSCGRKLLITGKGRCNITSSLNIEEFIKNIPGNGRFLYSAFGNFTNIDIIQMLEQEGVKTKNERGNRVFPVSDKSQDVLNALLKILNKLKVTIKTNAKVNKIIAQDNIAIGVETDSEKIYADKIILATGGKSYQSTGSTGDGFEFAKKLGHTVTDLKASLVPLEVYEIDLCRNLQGLSLKNVGIKVKDIEKNKVIYEDFGEMIFTHFGVSGPTILSASAIILRYKNINEILKNEKIKLYIDLKPALTEEQLDLRIRRDFEEVKNKQFKNSLDKLLPQKMIEEVITLSKINEITIKDFRPIEDAIITAGGIDIKQINPKTMESKLIKNLYFAGEIIDVDAYTGGFNLQIAYSTGFTAGMHIRNLDT